MEDIDVSPPTHTQIQTHAHTNTKAKSSRTMHLLSIKILHGAHEVIMITKQVLLPELLRPKFPDSSVWPKLTHNGGQQNRLVSERAVVPHTQTHTQTHIPPRGRTLFSTFLALRSMLAHAAPTHI